MSNNARPVLLVEDDPASAKAMAGILRNYGMNITCAGSVRAALDALGKQSFDYLLLDLMLPDGDGSVVLRAVRDQKLDIWVCVVTAANDPMLLQKVTELKPQKILRKPIDIGQLLGGMDLAQ